MTEQTNKYRRYAEEARQQAEKCVSVVDKESWLNIEKRGCNWLTRLGENSDFCAALAAMPSTNVVSLTPTFLTTSFLQALALRGLSGAFAIVIIAIEDIFCLFVAGRRNRRDIRSEHFGTDKPPV